jgi:hypothetical protein
LRHEGSVGVCARRLAPEQRVGVYQSRLIFDNAEMQQILHDDGGIIVLMFNNYGSAHTGKLAHGELNSNFDHDGGNIYEPWWFIYGA